MSHTEDQLVNRIIYSHADSTVRRFDTTLANALSSMPRSVFTGEIAVASRSTEHSPQLKLWVDRNQVEHAVLREASANLCRAGQIGLE